MDNIFLSEITKAYLNDNDKPKDNYSELYEYILLVRNSLRSTNRILYEEIKSESLSYQQKIIYRLFENYDAVKQPITEDFGVVSGPIVAGLLISVGALLSASSGPAIRTTYNTFLSSLSKIKNNFLSNSIIKKLGDQVKQHEVVLAMLDEEFSNCAKQCGVDISKKNQVLDFIQSRRNLTNNIDGPQCAISCTLDYLTSSFAELSKVYKICLEKTGEDLNLVNVTNNPLNAIPTGEGCHQIRSELDDTYKNFKKLIDVLFNESPQMKSMWINIMNQKVKDALAGRSVKHYNPREVQFDLKNQFISSSFK